MKYPKILEDFSKKVLFWPLHPLFVFRRNSFGLTIFSRKKNGKKMPRSCLKKKNSLAYFGIDS